MMKLGLPFTACLLALPLSALAQDLAISGTVTDQTGGVLPGVTVEAAGPGPAGGSRVAVTDTEGRYVLDGLPAGGYSVSFSLSGFDTVQRDGVSVVAPDGAALDAVLQFASFSEDVTVVGSKLDTGRQEFGASVAYLGPERLESDAIFTVEDAFNRTANAFTGTAQFGAYSIRGVNNNGLDSGFGNANALASILLNQTAVGPRTGDYLNPSLFDVGAVEISAPVITRWRAAASSAVGSATSERAGRSTCGAPTCSTTSTSWGCSTAGCSDWAEPTDGWPTRAPSERVSTSTGSRGEPRSEWSTR